MGIQREVWTVKKIGIIGAGNMDAGIAQKTAQEGIDVGYDKPLKEGVKEELAHLRKMFSTKDAPRA